MNKDQLQKLEVDLWSAADKLRANSDLKSSEYATPVLGLIFLKFADNNYRRHETEIHAEYTKLKGTRREKKISDIAIEKCGFYLPDHARYEHLLNLPEEKNIAKALKEAMKAIEEYKPELEGVLPKDEYAALTRTDKTIPQQLLRTFADIPANATGDLFGQIYEYFLSEFARSEGQKGGEFFTPRSVVRLMVEIIEPHGKQDGAWSRHPLAFLMEAADDICYRIIDLEDGHRVGRVSFGETEKLLKPVAFRSGEGEGSSYALIDDDDKKGKVEYLRARAISNLIYEAISVFEANYEKIMDGTFENDLMSQSDSSSHLKTIKELSRTKVYAAPNVLYIEAAGFEVLGGLLEKVVPALVGAEKTTGPAEKKILELIPSQFTKGKNQYEQLMSATDFVSGMTDSYAVTFYRRIRGIELPHG